MILGKQAILAAMERGEIVCEPEPRKINAASIDITIAAGWWERTSITPDVRRSYDPPLILDKQEPARAWQWMGSVRYPDYVIIPPQSVILARSVERIGTTVPWLLPVLHTRSTLARWGIDLHRSAGLGDPGYCNYWTLEPYNPHREAVWVPVGARVGSITFIRVEGAEELYEQSYGTWSGAASMLPKKGNW